MGRRPSGVSSSCMDGDAVARLAQVDFCMTVTPAGHRRPAGDGPMEMSECGQCSAKVPRMFPESK
jgi:hypothetical protein